MMNAIMIAATCAGLFGGAFALNEMSHGAVSQAMGMGHHHMFDYGGYHCADHDDPNLGPQHMSHMHNATEAPHAGCAGGRMMHGESSSLGR